MSAVAGDTASSVIAQVARRWQAIDPLLPTPEAPPAGCDAGLVVTGADGRPTAIGTCEHWEGAPGSLDLAWGAARRFQLTPQIAGPDVASALDQLLSLWRDHLAAHPGADDEDAAAVVAWPSRDIDGVVALLRHGLTPLAVVAARTTRHHPADGMARHDLQIRRAGPADIDTVVRLGLEVIRFDAHFSGAIERPGTAAALHREVAATLYAQRPEAAAWIAPMTGPAPVAYLMLMFVRPAERGSGAGAALVAHFHREIQAAGVPVTLLHYEQVNPLSAPFWSQQGYRPLWTFWEAWPARALR
jgi:GNAT superfamily N-acetyltransferase